MRRGLLLALTLSLIPALAAAQDEAGPLSPEDLAREIAARESSLAELSEKIQELRLERQTLEGEKRQRTQAVSLAENRARQARLELDYTTVAIEEVRLRIRQVQREISALAEKGVRIREQLREIVRVLAAYDRRSPLEKLLERGTFADFFQQREALARLQTRATALLLETQDLARDRQRNEADLATREDDLARLGQLQAAQKASLETEERTKRELLSVAVAEAGRVASRLAEAEQARREILAEVFVLRNVGIRVSLKEAEDYARYASGATGVRPALLLGVLKVESNVGTNIGTGRYPGDVHPYHREAFVRVAQSLGLDPAEMPASAKPTTYAGWGGALGPAQILPGTWERIAHEVARFVGKKTANPFELLDAFVGTAILLRNAGATAGNEYEAVNRYFAGPNWQRFTWYGDRVLAVAREYESRGL